MCTAGLATSEMHRLGAGPTLRMHIPSTYVSITYYILEGLLPVAVTRFSGCLHNYAEYKVLSSCVEYEL